jgi:serine protease Do
MRRSACAWLALGAVLLVGAGPPRAAPASPADPLETIERAEQALFSRVAPSVTFIADSRGVGSGFVVGADGLILTNAHVVGEARTVRVVLHDGRALVGKVLARAPDKLDLALVQVEARDLVPLELGGLADLKVGSFAASVGHGKGGIWTFNTGMVSNIYPAADTARPVFQTQIPLNPGSSGGPVLDRFGRVVGVVTAGITDSNSINFAIKIDVAIASFPELAPACGACIVFTAPSGVPVFLDGSMVGTGPKIVLEIGHGRHASFAVVRGVKRERFFSFPAIRSVDLGDDS